MQIYFITRIFFAFDDDTLNVLIWVAKSRTVNVEKPLKKG